MIRRVSVLLILVAVVLTSASLWPVFQNDRLSGPPQLRSPNVVQIPLSLSNVYLIKSAKPVLIDAGSPGDLPQLRAALAREGVDLRDIALILLTHGHADHAGGIAALREATSAKVALGAADASLAAAGRNDDLKTTSHSARFIKPMVDFTYPPFAPDTLIQSELDLAPYGIAGKAVLMPGHTAGSVVVELQTGEVFVGDMALGGTMGGALFPHAAGEHYFQADLEKNHRNLQTLVNRGFKTFYLGHGGPVSVDSVKRGFPHLFR